MDKEKQRRTRIRDDPDVPFELEIIEALEALLYPKPQKSVNTWGAPRGHTLTNFRYRRGAGLGRGLDAGFPLGVTMTTPLIPYSQCA